MKINQVDKNISKIQDNKNNTSFKEIKITRPAENFLKENLAKDCFEKFTEIQKAEANNPLTEVFIGLIGKTNWVNQHSFERLYMKVADKLFFAVKPKRHDYSNTFFEQLDSAIKYSNNLFKF